MARPFFCFLLFFLLACSYTPVLSHEDGYITAKISNKGLEFLKNLLIEKAESSLVPLEIPEIKKTVKVPVIGKVQMVVSKITIERIHVTSSTVQAGDSGIVIDVAGATAHMSMNWKYSYNTWLLPISVSDNGNATVEVEGLEVGLSLTLKTLQGSLKLSLLECGCYVNDISIKLNGGASWLYQGLVDAFEGKISSAVEKAVSQKLEEAIPKLDSLLQSLPKEIKISSIATINVTFVDDPDFYESSVDLEINGLIYTKDEVGLSSLHHASSLASSSCKEKDKMVKISVHENVLKSGLLVYFQANKMHWMVDEVPDQSLLNTAGWRFIIPQLYKMYPNCDMNLNLSVSSLPTIEVEKQQIKATVPLDVVIDVLDEDGVIPVACISVVITGSGTAEISRNSLTGAVKLNDFSMSLKWSNIGGLHMRLVQTLISTALKTVVLPYVNLELSKGLKLPVFHGYQLQDAQIGCTDSWIVVCSDLGSANQLYLA